MIDPSPVIILALLVGALAGAGGAAITLYALRALLPRLLSTVEVRLGVNPNDLIIPIHIAAPAGVRIPVTIAAPDAVTIPVELAPTITAAGSSTNPELAARILTEAPDIGPRALARILDVAPSTAQGYIARASALPPPVIGIVPPLLREGPGGPEASGRGPVGLLPWYATRRAPTGHDGENE